MRTNALPVFLALGLAGGLSVEAGFASPLQSAKRSKSDKDIAAIGHRKIVRGIDFFSPEKEKVLGKALSEEAERSVHLLLDPGIDGYIRRVAQNITQNSDSQMPIQVRVIDSEEVNACILPGGYQYVTRGLLLLLESEAELAGVLARGIAHTALRSTTREVTRASLMQASGIPGKVSAHYEMCETANSFELPLIFVAMRRSDELDADYFGAQYLYKAGYDPESFIRLIERVWSANRTYPISSSQAFSPFPPLIERVKALHKEVADLLPRREGTIVSTVDFEGFREHLRSLKPEKPRGDDASMPRLVRHDAVPQ